VHDPVAFAASGLTPRWPAMAPGKEPGHRVREIPQSLLLDDNAARSEPAECCPRLRQLPTLLCQARCRLTSWPPPRLLLDRQIPNEPGVRAVLAKCQLLRGRRQQAISGHESNLTATTDILREVKRRYEPALSAGFSTPRNP
jgi:hypothetical protein